MGRLGRIDFSRTQEDTTSLHTFENVIGRPKILDMFLIKERVETVRAAQPLLHLSPRSKLGNPWNDHWQTGHSIP